MFRPLIRGNVHVTNFLTLLAPVIVLSRRLLKSVTLGHLADAETSMFPHGFKEHGTMLSHGMRGKCTPHSPSP